VLTADDLHEMDDASSKIKIQGTRYPENLQKITGK
jgi:hypothetical protein